MKRKKPTNPYPGLRPFEFSENALFFGREGQSEEVLRRLRESRFVAVVGTSGSGKSSLVRAGLLPLLYGGLMTEAGARWRVALFRPGDDPINSLANALVHPTQFTSSNIKKKATLATGNESFDLAITETLLRRSAVGLRDYANGNELAADENLLVVVDQFEELFRFKKENPSNKIAEKSETQQKAENEASAFVKLLLKAARDESKRVYVVITMRSDFLGDCSQFRNLPEIINDGQYLIPRLTTEQLRKAIESPAKVKKARIEPVLCAQLLNDIGDDQDQLPVLQHALMRTWDKWPGDGEINFDNYNATGGMATALSIHANEAYNELGDEGSSEPTRKQKIAEKLFKCLTETDRENRETRRATPLGLIREIADASFDEVVEVIDVFRQAGRTFLMPPVTEKLDENTVIDISHESLIRKWDKLRSWVEEEAQASYTYRRLSEDARLHKMRKAPFWSDPQLAEALDWKEKFKPNETWAELYYKTWGLRYLSTYPEAMDFLEESRKFRENELLEEEAQRNREIEQERTLRAQAEQLALANEREAEKAKKLAHEQQRAAELEKQKKEQAELLAQANERETKAALALAEEKERLAESESEKAAVLGRSSVKLRRYLYAMAVMSLLFLGIAGFAGYMWWKADQNEKAARKSQLDADGSRIRAEFATDAEREAKERMLGQAKTIEKNNEDLRAKEKDLNSSLAKQKEETERAEEQKKSAEEQRKIAEEQKGFAEQKKIELATSLKTQEDLAKQAETDKNAALAAQKVAEDSVERERVNRVGMTFLEQGENEQAREQFQNLVDSYKKEEDNGGAVAVSAKWWALHNLGVANSRIRGDKNETDAINSYKEALNVLREPNAINSFKPLWQSVSYQVAPGAKESQEIIISKVTTLRRLAQFYSELARKTAFEQDAARFNILAIKKYNRIRNLLKEEEQNSKQPSYPAEVYVELADCYSALNEADLDGNDLEGTELTHDSKTGDLFEKAQDLYGDALDIYNDGGDSFKVLAVIKKYSDMAIKRQQGGEAVDVLKDAIYMQEIGLNLPALSLDLADTYDRLAKANRSAPKPDPAIDSGHYEQLAKEINDLEFKVNKSNVFNANDFIKLAGLYISQGNCGRAERVYLDGIDKARLVSKPVRDAYDLEMWIQTGKFYQTTGKDIEARKYFDMTYESLIKLPEDDTNDDNYHRFSSVADYYSGKEQFDRSLILSQRMRKLTKKVGGLYSRNETYAIGQIAHSYEGLGNYAEAEALYKEAIDTWKKRYPENPIINPRSSADLAHFYFRQGKNALALPIYEQLIGLYEPTIDRYVQLGYLYINNEIAHPSILSKIESYSYYVAKFSEFEGKVNSSSAIRRYENAIRLFDFLGRLDPGWRRAYPPDQFESRYFSGNRLSVNYYKDRAAILESWSKLLNGHEKEEKQAEILKLRAVLAEEEKKAAKAKAYCRDPATRFSGE